MGKAAASPVLRALGGAAMGAGMMGRPGATGAEYGAGALVGGLGTFLQALRARQEAQKRQGTAGMKFQSSDLIDRAAPPPPPPYVPGSGLMPGIQGMPFGQTPMQTRFGLNPAMKLGQPPAPYQAGMGLGPFRGFGG